MNTCLQKQQEQKNQVVQIPFGMKIYIINTNNNRTIKAEAFFLFFLIHLVKAEREPVTFTKPTSMVTCGSLFELWPGMTNKRYTIT